MRRKSEDNEATTRENENSRGKGGVRKKEIEVGSSKKDSRIEATCGSRDLCGSKTLKEKKVRNREKRHDFYRASKNTRSMNSSDAKSKK